MITVVTILVVMMHKIFTPPQHGPFGTSIGVFLAGSIEMGKAELWQDTMAKRIASFRPVFNPRRPDWDSSWKQDIADKNFRKQVNWELNALDVADIILMYFDPNTKAPISLLELGLFARSGKLRVYCPKGFWRLGSVQVVCAKYQIPLCYRSITDITDIELERAFRCLH